ncbi:Na+/H+ antiporter subunit D [Fredinandcohnia quinoae]|uniref:Na+/H+ antiporter subunit D n=1 Tax=Fredinandcohnia quinoae TaxID=2918902 RepID=A0AAW5E694_9BACI|nr:Na+/H+ antiporter subunit D [Fredinandcohnia sp. SECRCQ15]MCH1625506.1 Na+/H+ antiporter subunit D [Fredinandcohnia sp. SECRCQ15]
MNNVVILPILIPLLTGIILIFFNKYIKVQRWISFCSTLITVLVAGYLVQTVFTDGIQTLQLGSWKAPFGIVLVADMLAAILVLTASIIVFTCLIYSFRNIGKARESYYYYAAVQFLTVGVLGAFLTGDIFNLFVFFEVMLMSSYVLIVIGGTKIQLRESIKYILVNVISSALFVIAVAYLYAVTGTVNIADLSAKISEIGQPGITTVISILFLIVFGLKGAIFPLFFWLPGSYHAPPIPITALFGALLTKVGVYAIIRTFTIIFYHDTGFTHTLIGILAGFTILVGVIGAVAHWDVKKIIIYNILTAVGVILIGVATLTPTSLAGSIYYLVHDMMIKAALFLLVGAMVVITGTSNLRKMGGLITHHPYLGWMFFIAAISLAGIPPFSGFIGKLLIVQGGLQAEHYVLVGAILLSSLLVLYSVMRIFINGFWGEAKLKKEEEKGTTNGLLFPITLLVAISVTLGIGAEWFYPYIDQAAKGLADPTIYIQAVLKE